MTLKIAGQRFGRLVAIEDAGSKDKKRQWLFDCDCGKRVTLTACWVRSGHTQSCGCLRVERMRESRMTDISGQRFGRLQVVRIAETGGGRVKWECLCDCGKTVTRSSKNLVNGTAVSCGCRKVEALVESVAAREVDFTGRVFGKLTVLREVPRRPYEAKRWECKCSCGGFRVVLHGSLQSGSTISCGCARHDSIIYMPYSARAKSAVKQAARRARKRNAGGTFTNDDIDRLYKLQRGRCACCRSKLRASFHRDHRKALARGGDNSIHNIELLCSDCNLRKHAKDEIHWANLNGRLL